MFAFLCGTLPALSSIPEGSWEHWITNARNGIQSTRPDSLITSAPLPMWVDCHLGWWIDELLKQNKALNPHLRSVVLRGTPALCRGQAEEWVRK